MTFPQDYIYHEHESHNEQAHDHQTLPASGTELLIEKFHLAQEKLALEAEVMQLATCNAQGQTRVRSVLMRHLDSAGRIYFFTNYESPKAQDIEQNPKVHAYFYWPELAEQIHINGIAEKISSQESATYFSSRPREHQAAAHVSQQSQVIPNRQYLIAAHQKILDLYQDKEIPLPAHWGGYRITPMDIEFYRRMPYRLHDRIHYYLNADDHWQHEILAP